MASVDSLGESQFLQEVPAANWIRPLRHGLKFSFFSLLTATLCLAGLLFRFGMGWFDTALVIWIMFAFGAIVIFLLAWSGARSDASHVAMVLITQNTIHVRCSRNGLISRTHNDITCDLLKCQWFNGFLFHDSFLCRYPQAVPSIVLSWIHEDEEYRVALALESERREGLIEFLVKNTVPQGLDRLANERFTIRIKTAMGILIGAGSVTSITWIGRNLGFNLVFPEGLLVSSIVIGALYCRLLARKKSW